MADDRLIVPLDVPTVKEARQAIEELGDTVSFYKIGHQLAFSPERENGLHLARELVEEGKKVFLDLKLLDIDATVSKAVANVVRMGVHMLTIHAYPKAMVAAVDAAADSDLILLGVTVLTSMDDGDLIEAGYGCSATDLVERRAAQARVAGMGGVVASAQEARAIRNLVGDEMALVTPGIRPAGADLDDQKRVMTPANALRAGASHLVIGRPIMAAENRALAARDISDQMAEIQSA